MKNFLLSIVLFLLALNAFAQISKEEDLSLIDGTKLHYFKAYDQLNGLYELRNNKEVYLRGNYLNGKRVGNWFFFNNDQSLFLRYNYNTKQVISVNQETLALAKFKILGLTESDAVAAELPVLLFPLERLMILANKQGNVEIAKLKEVKNADKKTMEVVAKINDEGNALYFLRYNLINEQKEHPLVLDQGSFKIEWVPAKFKGRHYSSEVSFPFFLLENTENTSGHKRIDWGK